MLSASSVVRPWSEFHRRWSRLEPPLRPDSAVVGALRAQLASRRDRVLLLGVTPELAGLGERTVAVDSSAPMLASVWPGNDDERHALRADWLHLPCASGSFSAAVGDGSLSCLEYPPGYAALFDELARGVRVQGRVAIRTYLTPAEGVSAAWLRERVMNGAVASIHALKWELAHVLCTESRTPNVAVRSIVTLFDRLFPHRAALARATGWRLDEIAQIDAFDQLPDVFSFPTASELLAVVPRRLAGARLVPAGDYPLADRCPLLVADVIDG